MQTRGSFALPPAYPAIGKRSQPLYPGWRLIMRGGDEHPETLHRLIMCKMRRDGRRTDPTLEILRRTGRGFVALITGRGGP
jgi:hypothetical protein